GGGAWDGEVAYWLGPLAKGDVFAGGVRDAPNAGAGRLWFRESLLRAVAGLRAVRPVERVVVSGRLLEEEPELAADVTSDLGRFGPVERLAALPGAWVKHAAQGAAVIADGLAGGRFTPLVERLRLREAGGTVL